MEIEAQDRAVDERKRRVMRRTSLLHVFCRDRGLRPAAVANVIGLRLEQLVAGKDDAALARYLGCDLEDIWDVDRPEPNLSAFMPVTVGLSRSGLSLVPLPATPTDLSIPPQIPAGTDAKFVRLWRPAEAELLDYDGAPLDVSDSLPRDGSEYLVLKAGVRVAVVSGSDVARGDKILAKLIPSC